MKNLKSKLLASVAMLLVSTVMLTSASFAWFTISTAPEIKGITTTVVTNETLEIALDDEYANEAAVDTKSTFAAANVQSGNAYTWGNQVDVSGLTAYTALDKTLRPATLDTTFKAPTYGNDGRISDLNTAVTPTGDATTKAAADGFGTLKDANGKVYGYYIDYWMRSNVGGDVVLTTAVDRDGSGDTDATNATVGGGSTFKATNEETEANAANEVLAANIRVAFQDVTPTSSTSANRVLDGRTITAATTTVGTDKETATFSMGTGGKVVTLTANAAKLIRVYVYLEGASVTNAAASIDGLEIKGDLNLQFAIAAVDKSMLTPAA